MINERGIRSIKADEFIKRTGCQGENINIAVIDTGCNIEYPIFQNSIIGTKNFVGLDDESIKDENGHGTHVAGIIKSIAPKCNLLIIRVFNKYGGTVQGIITDALKYVYFWRGKNGEKIHIVNMSLGSPIEDEQMHTVIKEMYKAGMYVVCAQGNEGDGNFNTEEMSYPGYFEETLSVACCDYNGNIVHFSNSGVETDLSAPGYDIYSCYKDGLYVSMSGTSMAAPHATGAMALLMSAYKKYHPNEPYHKIDFQNELRRRCRQIMKNTYAEGAGMIDLSLVPYY